MTKKQIENIVWHIETNRRVAGDKQVLDDVLKSLKNFLKETAPEVPVQEQLIKLLEGITLLKWEQLRNCIDREFKSQANKTTFKLNDTFKKNLEIDITQ